MGICASFQGDKVEEGVILILAIEIGHLFPPRKGYGLLWRSNSLNRQFGTALAVPICHVPVYRWAQSVGWYPVLTVM